MTSSMETVRLENLLLFSSLGLLVGLVLYELVPAPTWIGNAGDDGAYYLMSRNVWHYGAPLLDQSGSAHWSSSWSPVLSLLLSPLGALPMGAAVIAERSVVLLSGLAFLLLSYSWLRREAGLDRLWAAAVTTLVAVTYPLVRASALVMSDVPSAALLAAGVVLMRRERIRAGLAALLLAALIRPIAGVALVAAVVWLVVRLRRRPQGFRLRPIVLGLVAACVVAVVAVIAVGGFTGYFSQIVHPGAGGVGRTIVQQVKQLTWYPVSWFVGGDTLYSYLRVVLKLLSLALAFLAVVGARRRGLGLEAAIVGATVAVLVVYRATTASEERYLIPLTPFVIGAIAIELSRRTRVWTGAAALLCLAGLASNLHTFAVDAPSPAAYRADVAERRRAYDWVRTHVARGAEVVAINDVQSFLYTKHPTDTSIVRFAPRRTFVIRIPYPPPAPDAWHSEHLLDGYRGQVVYRNGPISVVQVTGRRR